MTSPKLRFRPYNKPIRNTFHSNGMPNTSLKLLAAVHTGDSDTAHMLIAQGADVNHRLEDEARAPVLSIAAMSGHTNIARLLIEHGADVNAADNGGFTALMNAAVCGHTDTVRLLIDKGAQVDATDEAGVTALHIARAKEHTAIADMLRAAGAKE